ncbi:putative solute carrier family 25 member 38 protein [Diplogelasinospora grovesii]|uniref:Mitochondrial glycine transporter n=1 Tax=Diplogelasinospora grovesii TaxID=303347 RepID=A0AAN6S0U7_9PEZI|nr:putative solute carrier family 25 member 38 protein [Diplogelasinospora grovesii]
MSDGSRKGSAKSTFHFVAGLGSGVLSAVLLQPFDLLKTRVQQGGTHHTLSGALADIRAAATAAATQRRGGPLLILPQLWRGAVPSALRTGFGSAIYFTSLNAIRQNAAKLPYLSTASSTSPQSSALPKLSNTGNLVAGVVARSFAGFILMPLTVLKVRYESSMYNYGSLAGAAKDIAGRDGIRGFFAGVGATAIRDAPYAGLYVLFYEQSKKRLSHILSEENGKVKTEKMGVSRAATINFVSGMSAGVICSVISNPFDAVKTRIQLQPGEYRNMWHAAKRIVGGERGVRALWDGLALRMTRKALSSALAWTVYEELIRRAEISFSPTSTAARTL